MRIYLLLFIMALSFTSFAQELVLKGRIIDKQNQDPINSVEISSVMAGKVEFTNNNGEYKIVLPKWSGLEIIFHHPFYHDFYLKLPKDVIVHEEIVMDISLNQQEIALETVDIPLDKVYPPDTMFSSKVFSISDFEFEGDDHYIFLTYKKRLEKEAEVIYATADKTIIDRFTIPGEAIELRKDFLGFVNVYCENKIYRVSIENERLKLYKLPKEDYHQMIEPVVDSIGEDYYHSNHRWNVPDFNYYLYDRVDSSNVKIKTVVDPVSSDIYYFEYYYLTGKERVYAMKMETRTGVSRHEIANQMTGYTNSLLYKPTYAPMFKCQDTMLVFDHYASKIFKFGKNDTLPSNEVDISYHMIKKWKTWKRELVQDELNPDYIYAVFEVNTKTFLKKINTNTGYIESITPLTHKYIDKMKIKDEFIYYTYKPSATLQKKFLYRQRLN